MREDEIRALVRETLARHLGRVVEPAPDVVPLRLHMSHARFELPPTPDGACLIEPSVQCTHCGFCQSYGH